MSLDSQSKPEPESNEEKQVYATRCLICNFGVTSNSREGVKKTKKLHEDENSHRMSEIKSLSGKSEYLLLLAGYKHLKSC